MNPHAVCCCSIVGILLLTGSAIAGDRGGEGQLNRDLQPLWSSGSIAAPLSAFAPCLEYIAIPHSPSYPSLAWGDFTNDDLQDFVFVGGTVSPTGGRVYINTTGSSYTEAAIFLPNFFYGSVMWGDYDNDGDLDILAAGSGGVSGAYTTIFQNSMANLVDINPGLPGIYQGTASWGDYDNDGDLDVLITGNTQTEIISRIYRYSPSAPFEDIGATLPGLFRGSGAWGDYDNDGDLDVLLTGNAGTAVSPSPVAEVYRNDGGDVFTAIGAGLTGVWKSSGMWIDFDNDGDLDIGTIGATGTDAPAGAAPISRVYRNTGGLFTDTGAAIVGVYEGAMSWGEYDGDGDGDPTIMGYTGAFAVARQYRNNITGFTNVGTLPDFEPEPGSGDPTGLYDGGAEWGHPIPPSPGTASQLIIAGFSTDPFLTGDLVRLYRPTCSISVDYPPTAPSGLIGQLVGDQLTLSWSAAADGGAVPSSPRTPPPGLSYNLRVGTTPGGGDVVSPMATASGFRQVSRLGNAQKRTSWTLSVPPAHDYYWSVQALDAAYLGGQFAPEQHVAGLLDVDDGVPSGQLQLTCANPVIGTTEFVVGLGREMRVRLTIRDIAGRGIASIVDESLSAGRHRLAWTPGPACQPGMYFAELNGEGQTVVYRLTVLR